MPVAIGWSTEGRSVPVSLVSEIPALEDGSKMLTSQGTASKSLSPISSFATIVMVSSQSLVFESILNPDEIDGGNLATKVWV